ncbi:MAG: hypothetical protein OEZ47_17875 [Gammaproteobacteria bacterium]|nr:hypothetical protein [Gammaproteobacteria bacterium]
MTKNKVVGALCFLLIFLVSACAPLPSPAKNSAAVKINGYIDNGTYLSPEKLFRVDVPEMRNPFIKRPTTIWDESTPHGGVEVNFAVTDLGEAHCYGVRQLSGAENMDVMFNEELSRWARKWVDRLGEIELISEEKIQLADGAGFARIYLVESASLLFVRRGEGTAKREPALVGVVIVPLVEKRLALYLVSQFDMPNRGGHFTLETKKGRKYLSEEQINRMRQLAESFRLQR